MRFFIFEGKPQNIKGFRGFGHCLFLHVFFSVGWVVLCTVFMIFPSLKTWSKPWPKIWSTSPGQTFRQKSDQFLFDKLTENHAKNKFPVPPDHPGRTDGQFFGKRLISLFSLFSPPPPPDPLWKGLFNRELNRFLTRVLGREKNNKYSVQCYPA